MFVYVDGDMQGFCRGSKKLMGVPCFFFFLYVQKHWHNTKVTHNICLQFLTHIRLSTQVAIATLLGLLFLDIGNEATKVLENAALLFFTLMYSIFAALMPTVLTCKFIS